MLQARLLTGKSGFDVAVLPYTTLRVRSKAGSSSTNRRFPTGSISIRPSWKWWHRSTRATSISFRGGTAPTVWVNCHACARDHGRGRQSAAGTCFSSQRMPKAQGLRHFGTDEAAGVSGRAALLRKDPNSDNVDYREALEVLKAIRPYIRQSAVGAYRRTGAGDLHGVRVLGRRNDRWRVPRGGPQLRDRILHSRRWCARVVRHHGHSQRRATSMPRTPSSITSKRPKCTPRSPTPCSTRTPTRKRAST